MNNTKNMEEKKEIVLDKYNGSELKHELGTMISIYNAKVNKFEQITNSLPYNQLLNKMHTTGLIFDPKSYTDYTSLLHLIEIMLPEVVDNVPGFRRWHIVVSILDAEFRKSLHQNPRQKDPIYDHIDETVIQRDSTSSILKSLVFNNKLFSLDPRVIEKKKTCDGKTQCNILNTKLWCEKCDGGFDCTVVIKRLRLPAQDININIFDDSTIIYIEKVEFVPLTDDLKEMKLYLHFLKEREKRLSAHTDAKEKILTEINYKINDSELSVAILRRQLEDIKKEYTKYNFPHIYHDLNDLKKTIALLTKQIDIRDLKSKLVDVKKEYEWRIKFLTEQIDQLEKSNV